MKTKLAALVLIGGLLAPLALAADANPKVEDIIAQIDARRAEKLASESKAAQERAKQMEERGTNWRGNGGGGGMGGRRNGGGNNQGGKN